MPDCARTQVMAPEFINPKRRKRLYEISGFSVADLSAENFNPFLSSLENELKCLHYNANQAIPIYSGTLMEQLDLVNEMDPRSRLFFSTNGSGKSAKFWKLFIKVTQQRSK